MSTKEFLPPLLVVVHVVLWLIHHVRLLLPTIPIGGGGVVFNNIIHDTRFGIAMVLETGARGPYPVKGQVHDLFMWNNKFTGLSMWHKTGAFATRWGGTSLDAEEYIKEGRDYHYRAPSQEKDGFTYSSYTYPHPLVTGR